MKRSTTEHYYESPTSANPAIPERGVTAIFSVSAQVRTWVFTIRMIKHSLQVHNE
jgi:hypothetical protein